MKTGQSTKLWSLFWDSNEYKCFLNLLNGRLKNSLTPEAVSEQMIQAGLFCLSFKNRIEVIYDGSDICICRFCEPIQDFIIQQNLIQEQVNQLFSIV